MRLLICGDRNWTRFDLIWERVKELPKDTVIIEGDARGADKYAGTAARKEGLKLEVYPADWELYGRAAGPIRNKQMLVEGKPDEVWAFHDALSESKGTKNTVELAKRAGLKVRVFTTIGEEQYDS